MNLKIKVHLSVQVGVAGPLKPEETLRNQCCTNSRSRNTLRKAVTAW